MRVRQLGDTAVRPAGPWSPAVHALLAHLHRAGFEGAPRPVALDREHEVVTWLPGEVGARPLAGHVRADAGLAAVARMLRAAHDASRGCPAAGPWQRHPLAPDPDPGPGPVICHNDVGPWNTVYRDGEPAGFIDWDLAAPGPRAWDVAGAVWHFVPLYDDAECVRIGWPSPPERDRRVRVFLDAYGIQSLGGMVRRRQEWYLARVRAAHADPEAPGADVWCKVDPAVVEADLAFADTLRLP